MEQTPETKFELKICQSCGDPFGCGAKVDGCWCEDVKLSAEAASDIKSEFTDCLCEKCLRLQAVR